MYKNYLKMAVRNIRKHPGYSLINITGLAIGIASCLLIIIFIQDELSYDRMHSKYSQIYRIGMTAEEGRLQYVAIGGGVAPDLFSDYPEVVSSARMLKQNQLYVEIDGQNFEETGYYLADSSFFNMFDFKFISGDPNTALFDPYSVVLTEEMARKYFGSIDVLDRGINVEFGPQPVSFTVKGVVENIPDNSHMHFDGLMSMSSIVQANPQGAGFMNSYAFTMFYSYIELSEGTPADNIAAQLPEFLARHATEEEREFTQTLFLQPLSGIHLGSNILLEHEPNSDMSYIYIFAAVAFLILLIACLNFMNLTTAKSSNRAKEVGVRKVIGAYKSNLIVQFLAESILIVILALGLAVIFAYGGIGFFNNLAAKSLELNFVENSLASMGLILIALVVSLVAGGYPAFFLSSFKPIDVIKGKMHKGSSSGLFRKIFVVFQFSVSIAFIIGSGIVFDQLEFIRTTDIGFQRSNKIVLPVRIPNAMDRVQKMEILKREYLQLPGVESVTKASSVPGQLRAISFLKKAGAPASETAQMAMVSVDFDYQNTMEVKLKDGRFFTEEMASDLTSSFIVNERGAELLGIVNVNDDLFQWVPGNFAENQDQIFRTGKVIGILKDLKYEGFYRNVEPMFFLVAPNQDNFLVVSTENGKFAEVLPQMEAVWASEVTTREFSYTFLDEDILKFYEAEERLSSVVGVFTILAIFIACLGLFGLASFTAGQRTKEIGVRKVLGATEAGIVGLLSREFLILVILSNIVAWPLAYFTAQNWLSSFIYKADLNPLLFFGAALAALVISQLSVSYQAIKAARTNPVTALQCE